MLNSVYIFIRKYSQKQMRIIHSWVFFLMKSCSRKLEVRLLNEWVLYTINYSIHDFVNSMWKNLFEYLFIPININLMDMPVV